MWMAACRRSPGNSFGLGKLWRANIQSSLPLLLWLAMKAVKNRNLVFWITVAVFLLTPMGLRCFLTFGNWDDGLRKVTFFRLDAIMFGVILAFLQERPKCWERFRRPWSVGVDR